MNYTLNTVLPYTKSLTILYVEDNNAIREAMAETLSLLCKDLYIAKDGLEGIEKYHHFFQKNRYYFDIVITDIQMPRCNGIEMSRKILLSNSEQEIIILSAHENSEELIAMINMGIKHFLLKPIRIASLMKTLQHIGKHITAEREKLQMMEQIRVLNSELEHKVAQLETLVNEDPLTGISNRRRFFHEADRLLHEYRENGLGLFLAIVDIDDFKSVNDTYGHIIGDSVLKRFVATVLSVVGEEVCFARLGGDEFVLIQYRCSAEETYKKIEAIRLKIASIKHIDGIDVQFTISIGVAQLRQSDHAIDDLIARADEKLYEAKRKGRNRVMCDCSFIPMAAE